MQAMSKIALEDLRKTAAYLSGLVVILDQLQAERRGIDGEDVLIKKLETVPEGISEWAPLRYQDGVGTGWEFVSRNVTDLIGRLDEQLAPEQ